MLKIICTFIGLMVILAILCSNKVESRALQRNYELDPSLQLRYFRIGKDRLDSESSGEDDRGNNVLAKRKSELLSSLYALPYGLIDDHHHHAK